MNYTAQRKKRIRINWMLILMLSLLGVFSLISFMNNSFGYFFNQYRFQYYIASIVIMIYAMYHRFFLYSFLALVLIFLNFFVVSAYVPVYLRGKDISSGHSIRLIYQSRNHSLLETVKIVKQYRPDLLSMVNMTTLKAENSRSFPQDYQMLGKAQKSSLMITPHPSDMIGYITLGKNNHAVFSSLKLNNKEYVFLSLDLSLASYKEKKKAFKYLSNFVSAQDEPVIIFGDFGLPAWSFPFRKFLNRNGLEVKNTLFSSSESIFSPETKYIIGYKNLYFAKSLNVSQNHSSENTVLYELKF